jgi:hypothetical protein
MRRALTIGLGKSTRVTDATVSTPASDAISNFHCAAVRSGSGSGGLATAAGAASGASAELAPGGIAELPAAPVLALGLLSLPFALEAEASAASTVGPGRGGRGSLPGCGEPSPRVVGNAIPGDSAVRDGGAAAQALPSSKQRAASKRGRAMARD